MFLKVDNIYFKRAFLAEFGAELQNTKLKFYEVWKAEADSEHLMQMKVITRRFLNCLPLKICSEFGGEK